MAARNLPPFLLLYAVRLFFGASFISAENSDIYFEWETALYFYAFGNVFRKSSRVQQDCIDSNRFELERTIPKN